MRLTHTLAKTLRAIRRFDGDEGFMADLVAQKSPVEGYAPRRLVHDIGELQREGMLTIEEFQGQYMCFDLTAKGRDYSRNRVIEAFKVVGRLLLQFFMGASGGFVVWLLTHLFE